MTAASLDWIARQYSQSRVPVGSIPTPLERLDSLGADLGVELLIKREDLIDGIGCGNKLRRLGYQIADALHHGSSVLLTAGSLQSNQCKAVAAYGPRFGLRAHLVYAGDVQERPLMASGNYLVTGLMRPTVTWFERSPWSRVEDRLAEVRAQEERVGHRVYVIGPGGSPWPGLLGPIELGYELAAQLALRRVEEAHIVAVAGTGYTCLGLRIAAQLLNKPWRVHGVAIAGTAQARRDEEHAVVKTIAASAGLDLTAGRQVEFHDDAVGQGYDQHMADEVDAMAELARRHALLLDPNYMLKAYLGLKKLIANGTIASGSHVVLVHSGGQFGVFAATPSLANGLGAVMGDMLRCR